MFTMFSGFYSAVENLAFCFKVVPVGVMCFLFASFKVFCLCACAYSCIQTCACVLYLSYLLEKNFLNCALHLTDIIHSNAGTAALFLPSFWSYRGDTFWLCATYCLCSVLLFSFLFIFSLSELQFWIQISESLDTSYWTWISLLCVFTTGCFTFEDIQ